MISPNPAPPSTQVIHQLGSVCQNQGLDDLASRLLDLQQWVRQDLIAFEKELDILPKGVRAVQHAAHHLLDLRGKYLRPMCVVLAARTGKGFGPSARQLAMAVELVHTATLLHDDVVDQSELRRGQPSSRCVYGNAASVFAGDWLLVQALKRIRSSGIPNVLDRMLEVIEQMILAESMQLEHRGKIRANIADYFSVVEGKTASLFRWAMFAGACAGGLSASEANGLEEYGFHLGVAFQAIDDLLDFTGSSGETGKTLFADLREGKMTYPLAVALDRDPDLHLHLKQWVQDAPANDTSTDPDIRPIRQSLEQTGALFTCRKLAHDRVAQAIASLDVLPDGRAKSSLITIAEATAYRER